MGSLSREAVPLSAPLHFPHPIHFPGPCVEAGLFPINTSPLTCAFFLYDFSCFDETLPLAVQVPEGTEAQAPASRSFKNSTPRPASHPAAFRQGHNLLLCVNEAGAHHLQFP